MSRRLRYSLLASCLVAALGCATSDPGPGGTPQRTGEGDVIQGLPYAPSAPRPDGGTGPAPDGGRPTLDDYCVTGAHPGAGLCCDGDAWREGCCYRDDDCPDDGDPCTRAMCLQEDPNPADPENLEHTCTTVPRFSDESGAPGSSICEELGSSCSHDDECPGIDDAGLQAERCDATLCAEGECVRQIDLEAGCQTCESDADCTRPLTFGGAGCSAWSCVRGSCRELFTDGPGCCLASIQCDDGDGCTDDWCDDRNLTCHNEPRSGCTPCTSPSECDDGNSCTDDLCQPDDGFCTHRTTLSLDCVDCLDHDDCAVSTPCTDWECRERDHACYYRTLSHCSSMVEEPGGGGDGSGGRIIPSYCNDRTSCAWLERRDSPFGFACPDREGCDGNGWWPAVTNRCSEPIRCEVCQCADRNWASCRACFTEYIDPLDTVSMFASSGTHYCDTCGTFMGWYCVARSDPWECLP